MSLRSQAFNPISDCTNLLVKKTKRIFDARLGLYSMRLLPGECYVTAASDEVITTVLGSCIAACIRNPRTGYGGMNHFMLPESETGQWSGVSMTLRYGNHAMEVLINEVLKSGCRREELEIKLFGGSDLYKGPSQVGSKNSSFVLNYLETEKLRPAVIDLGGNQPRVIRYIPSSGGVNRLLLRRLDVAQLVEAEEKYKAKLNASQPEGDIELFD